LASVVLPTPGTSSMSRWPRASSVTSESSTTSGFPSRACSTAERSFCTSGEASRAIESADVIGRMLARPNARPSILVQVGRPGWYRPLVTATLEKTAKAAGESEKTRAGQGASADDGTDGPAPSLPASSLVPHMSDRPDDPSQVASPPLLPESPKGSLLWRV